jgi:flagellar biosynthesis protein FlhG
VKDQAQRLRELARSVRTSPGQIGAEAGRVLAVASGKGGVGKTSLVANLGLVLAGRGHSVTIIDADFGLANIDILLNLNPPKNLSHLVRGEAEPEDVVVNASPRMRVIPGASGIASLADLDDSERDRLLASLTALTGREEFVLVDTAAGIGRNVVALCLAAGEVVLVTNPEPASLADAYGLTKVLWAQNPDTPVLLVVNSVATAEEGRGVHERLDHVVGRFLRGRLGYLGHISRDAHVGRAAVRQTPFATAYPRCAATRCLHEIADVLLGSPSVRSGSSFWQRLLAGGAG